MKVKDFELGIKYRKAMAIVAEGLVSPNGVTGQYYVISQSGNGRYLAATRSTFPPAGRCNCPDFKKRGGPCKHVLAAEIYEQAPANAQALARHHNISLDVLENRLVVDLAIGVRDQNTANALMVLLDGCRRLKAAGQ